MTKTAFVYVTYISAPQEKVWKALTDREFTRQYWAHDNVSDWKPGSTWEHRESEAPHTLKLVGRVVEFTPPRRLVMTWEHRESEAPHTLKLVGKVVEFTPPR